MAYSADQRIFATNKLVAVVEMLEKEGISVDDALRGVAITPAALQDAQTRMSVRQLLTGYRNAAALSRDPDFALRLGNSVQVTSYGIYGFAMLSCPTHHATIDFALRYHGLSCASAALGFRREESGDGTWTIRPADEALGDARLSRFVVEVNAATIVALARDIVAPDYNPLRVRFAFPRPAAPMSYEAIFRCDVLFDQGVNEMDVPADWLQGRTAYGGLTAAMGTQAMRVVTGSDWPPTLRLRAIEAKLSEMLADVPGVHVQALEQAGVLSATVTLQDLAREPDLRNRLAAIAVPVRFRT